MPTKQEITTRREQLEADGVTAMRIARAAREAAIGAELASLRELCGATGHVFADCREGFDARRACVFCRISQNG